MRFWDSSALVPLVIAQPAGTVVDAWLKADPVIVVWRLTNVEIVSALWRLVREGALTEDLALAGEALAHDLLQTAQTIIDVDRTAAEAIRLLRVHPLRAADAMQLGAACVWADGQATELTVHTLDRRLAQAARREGFLSPAFE